MVGRGRPGAGYSRAEQLRGHEATDAWQRGGAQCGRGACAGAGQRMGQRRATGADAEKHGRSEKFISNKGKIGPHV